MSSAIKKLVLKKKTTAKPGTTDPKEEDVSDIPISLLRLKECFGYVLSGSNDKGYYAKDWNLENPEHTGELSVLAKGDMLMMRLKNGEGGVFCETAPMDLKEIGKTKPLTSIIESCKDSSRYFVVRVQDPKSRRVLPMGIGFRERQSAFDLSAVIGDRIKMVQRHQEIDKEQQQDELKSKQAAGTSSTTSSSSSSDILSLTDLNEALAHMQSTKRPSLDFGLKEGQKLVLNSKFSKSGADEINSGATLASSARPKSSAGSFVLAPPPAVTPSPSIPDEPEVAEEVDDDWADFATANPA